MKSTVINTSKERTAFSDFPPPKEAATFMHNSEMLEYLRSYAKKFDLVKHVRFNTLVVSAKKGSNFGERPSWTVISKSE